MDTGTEMFGRLSTWCKDHRHGVRSRNQWDHMVRGAAADIHRDLLKAGFAPLGEVRVEKITSDAEQWWWKQNAHSPYGRARSVHGKGNPVKPTALDEGID